MELKYPVFNDTDRSLFNIKDARTRADTLQIEVVPKLETIFELACNMIQQAYELDPFEKSTVTRSPEHRKDAERTRLYKSAYVGLVPKQKARKYFFFKLMITIDDSGMMVMMRADRPFESSKLFDLLKGKQEAAVRLLDRIDSSVWSSRGFPPDTDNLGAIRTMSVETDTQWFHTGVVGTVLHYPIDDEDQLFQSAIEFAGIFAIYQAVLERLHGSDSDFERAASEFDEWLTGLDSGPDHSEVGHPLRPDPEPDVGPSGRSVVEVTRLERDTKVTRHIKLLYDNKCQICGVRLVTPAGAYSECAHVRPLGAPHDGPDHESNALCLCPNHHALFDRFGFTIENDLTLRGEVGRLHTDVRHVLNPVHLAYHRSQYEERRRPESF